MGINRVVLSGNLTDDAEVLYAGTGDPVLNFGIAFADRRRNAVTGEWEDFSNYIDCAVFGRRGESLAAALRKGDKVVVEGRLRYSSWEKEGLRKTKIEVVVDEVDLFRAPTRKGSAYGGEEFIRSLGGKPVEYFEEER